MLTKDMSVWFIYQMFGKLKLGKSVNAVSKIVQYTVDGKKVPDVHRRLILQKVSVSRNLSQKVMPSDEDVLFILYFFILSYYLQVKVDEGKTIYFRC